MFFSVVILAVVGFYIAVIQPRVAVKNCYDSVLAANGSAKNFDNCLHYHGF